MPSYDQKILAVIRFKLLEIQEDLKFMDNKEDVIFIEPEIENSLKRVEFCSAWNLIKEVEK